MDIQLTEEEFREAFRPWDGVERTEAGMPTCPYCHTGLSPENLEHWNNVTEAGTPYCDIEIRCHHCTKVVLRGGSWWPGIETHQELRDVANEVISEEITWWGRTPASFLDGDGTVIPV